MWHIDVYYSDRHVKLNASTDASDINSLIWSSDNADHWLLSLKLVIVLRIHSLPWYRLGVVWMKVKIVRIGADNELATGFREIVLSELYGSLKSPYIRIVDENVRGTAITFKNRQEK
jgi:hypothetical protein